VREPPVEVPPRGRRADYGRWLGTLFGKVPRVLIEPQAPDRGRGIRRAAVAPLAKKVNADVAVTLQLRLVYQVVGGLLGLVGI
jgi:hypothetical protein